MENIIIYKDSHSINIQPTNEFYINYKNGRKPKVKNEKIYCPNCGKILIYYHKDRCTKCNQTIDWSMI